MESVLIDGLRIAYERAGEGPPLLLLHGNPIDRRMWRPQLASLSDTFTVIAPDTPGCGASADPPPGASIDDFAGWMAEFVAALGLGPVHVVGLSFGTCYALAVHQRHPELARTLVLASAYAGWFGSLPRHVAEARKEMMSRNLTRPLDTWVDDWIATLIAPSAPATLREELRAIARDIRPSGQQAVMHAFGDLDLRDMLGTIAVPTLLVYGDLDVRSPPDVARAMHAAIPGSQLVMLPGIGHMVNLEAPDRFDAEVRRFVAQR